MSAPRKGVTQMAHGGAMPLDDTLTPEHVDFAAIATHLACQSRFAGATGLQLAPTSSGGVFCAYTVAQHSVEVCRILADWDAPPSVQLYGLLHDAHEAVMGDLTRPVAQTMPVEARVWWGDLKRRLNCAIFQAAGLPAEWPTGVASLVTRADEVALVCEAVCLLEGGPRRDVWDRACVERVTESSDFRLIDRWPPMLARARFLTALDQLRGQLSGAAKGVVHVCG